MNPDSTADAVLKYISQILMEEELEDPTFIPQNVSLWAAEKTFSDIFAPQPSSSSPAGSVIGTYHEQQMDSSVNVALGHSQPDAQFKRGTNEIWELYKRGNELILDFANNSVTPVLGTTEKSNRDHKFCKLKEREKQHRKKNELETRHFSVYMEEAAQLEIFGHEVFPSSGTDCFNLNEVYQNGKICRNNQVSSSELVDMRTLLIHCAEAVASDDHRNATELLTQIRQHSTPFGDGSQRLAHCFADALEARMAGARMEAYRTTAAEKITTPCMLKACRHFISAIPFLNTSNIFATQTILDVAENAARVHIIHFGIFHGFPWPSLIQHLSTRPGGPPVLHITGIEFPHCYGSAATLEEVGRYLGSYCEKFSVPFVYNAIIKNWESIRVEDLKMNGEEVTVVSSLYRFRHLFDETVELINSQRDTVLNLIKRINPAVFIHGIINGTYNSPFFISRFREALFYYSSLFDMLEANTGREDTERLVFEQEVFGREILNVIACEGWERVERPEKYKQWQGRNVRAGLRQLPLKEGTMQRLREQVRLCYHKDFLIDRDGQWMLQGWKGRILFAISCWKSA